MTYDRTTAIDRALEQMDRQSGPRRTVSPQQLRDRKIAFLMRKYLGVPRIELRYDPRNWR